MNKLYCLIIFVSQIITDSNCQTIINGDFENNSATTCKWNLPNSSYNNFMSNSWGFGNYTELDIQKGSCGYANSPSNIWFVSIAKGLTGAGDAFSLEIDTNLITGNTYLVSYYEYSTNANGNQNIPLEIGLSYDSLSFGDLIHTSLPSVNTWTHPAFTFIAPNNGKYLTIRVDSATTMYGWNFVDNFQIFTTAGINDFTFHNSIKINPNPFSDNIKIDIFENASVEIIIYDITSRKLFQQKFTNSATINTEQFAKGIYFYEVRRQKGIIKKGKLVKE